MKFGDTVSPAEGLYTRVNNEQCGITVHLCFWFFVNLSSMGQDVPYELDSLSLFSTAFLVRRLGTILSLVSDLSVDCSLKQVPVLLIVIVLLNPKHVLRFGPVVYFVW